LSPAGAPSAARAELVADRGVRARSDDFFRSPAFLEAEGVTHTLSVVSPNREALLPVIVRSIGDSEFADAISPYGYPGALVRGDGAAPDPERVDWRAAPVVSVFARERLDGPPWIARARELSTVLVHDPSLPRRVRPRLAEQIRAGVRAGWAVEVVPGPSSSGRARDAFARAYAETMTRAGAARRYFFDRDYLDAALSFERSWLLLARRDGEPGAGAIVAASDGHLHYFLGATSEAARSASPFKNVVAAMLDLADEQALPLNLGGGVAAGDGLERFKRGFANAQAPFCVHRVVPDPGAYERLAGSRPETADEGRFFPAYRAPSESGESEGG
jgi:Acetyltransferase (GNAT) domain